MSLERQFALAQRVADEYGAPLWSGEYGYWGEPTDVEARLSRYATTEDAHLLGSAYWVWKQACGDPQNGIGPVGDGLMMQDCTTGGDAPPKQAVLDILSRAYPRSAPGSLTSLEAQGATISLAGTMKASGCGLEVWIPGTAKPNVRTTGITRVVTTEVPGGWSVTGCADGDYTLTTKH